MSAIYYPDGIDAKVMAKIRERGVVVAGGLHSAIRDKYFRVGHMGIVSAADISATLSAIEGALFASGYGLMPVQGWAQRRAEFIASAE